MAAERAYPFPLLHDEGNAFAKSLGLVHALPDDLRKALSVLFKRLNEGDRDPATRQALASRVSEVLEFSAAG